MKKSESNVLDHTEVVKNIHRQQDPYQEIDPSTFEFKTIDDFEIFNKWARKNGRPVRVPTEEYHKKVKVKFQRFDQPKNVLKAKVRRKDIEWEGQLIPGKTYELSIPVVKFLNELSEPIYAEVQVDDSSMTKTETKQVGEKSKFSCQAVDFGE